MSGEITGNRLAEIAQGRCPECGCVAWQPGPRGGASQNFECVGCKRRYNVTIVGREVLFAMDIGHEGGDWIYYRRYFGIGPLLPLKQ